MLIMFLQDGRWHNPLRASSYIQLANPITQGKAVINNQNSDQRCFAWSIIAGLNKPAGKTDGCSPYTDLATRLDLSGVEFPLKVADIGTFLGNNLTSINVYGIADILDAGKLVYDLIGPSYYSRDRKANHINLLYFENNAHHGHYCYIRNLSKLVGTQFSKDHQQKQIFDGCLQYLTTLEPICFTDHRSI